MPRKLIVILFCLLCALLSGLNVSSDNRVEINGIAFRAVMEGEIRIGDYNLQTLGFTSHSESYPDSAVIFYEAPELELRLSFTPAHDLWENVWQSTVRADFREDIMLRQLNLRLDFEDFAAVQMFSGAQAVQRNDVALNRIITPYSNKICAFSKAGSAFWLAASNFRGCSGVETLSTNRIKLYDYSLHYFRQYQYNGSVINYPRDCLPQKTGDARQWSWLWFEEKPVVLDLHRYPGDKQAALSITNDPDAETSNKVMAIFMGSNNPLNPKFGSQGLIPHGIPVSNGIFGADQSLLENLPNLLISTGNTIAYHTFANEEDPPGSNATALLSDLVPYNIRLWTDHSVTNNPECLGYNGLMPDSPNYIGDVINQSSICYAWMNDSVPTNPFNAFDDPWRLPHRLYEMTALTKPVWFFGRTKELTWESLNGNITTDMKHILTPDNLDKLLQDGGLHICYTNFYLSNSQERNSFYINGSNGDFEIRPEVESLLEQLVFYRDNCKLWIATPETVFDRLLATEKVIIDEIQPTGIQGCFMVKIKNNSDYNLTDFTFSHGDHTVTVPNLAANNVYELYLNSDSIQTPAQEYPRYAVYYQGQTLLIKKTGGGALYLTKVKIFNLKGQKVMETTGSIPVSELVTLPVSRLASGVFFAEIAGEDHTPQRVKFIVLK